VVVVAGMARRRPLAARSVAIVPGYGSGASKFLERMDNGLQELRRESGVVAIARIVSATLALTVGS
jgi:hypothetical protein